MAELWNRPLRRSVALGAILAEQVVVPIFGGMAARAIQDCLLRGDARIAFRPYIRGLVLVDPVEEIFPHQLVGTIR